MFYSKFSDKIFQSSYDWRSKYFQPVWKLLTKMGITANGITFFRLIFIIPLYLLSFVWPNIYWLAIFYIIFWLIDLLDGGLARYQSTSSDRGKFLDIFVDVFMYSFVLVCLMNFNYASLTIIAYQILIHITVYVLAIIKKQEGKKTDWIILPKPDLTYLKFTAHAIWFLAVFFNFNIINEAFTLINLYMTFLSLYYFITIINKKVWKI